MHAMQQQKEMPTYNIKRMDAVNLHKANAIQVYWEARLFERKSCQTIIRWKQLWTLFILRYGTTDDSQIWVEWIIRWDGFEMETSCMGFECKELWKI